jgi:hypothetical protein
VSKRTSERDPISQLRRFERNWRVARWMVLALAFIAIAIGIRYVLLARARIAELLASPDKLTQTIGLMWAPVAAKAEILIIFAAVVGAWVIVRWRGNPAHRAILQLADLNQRSQESSGHDA